MSDIYCILAILAFAIACHAATKTKRLESRIKDLEEDILDIERGLRNRGIDLDFGKSDDPEIDDKDGE